jgi:hypothetical protein
MGHSDTRATISFGLQQGGGTVRCETEFLTVAMIVATAANYPVIDFITWWSRRERRDPKSARSAHF